MILGIKMKLICILLVATVMTITIDGVYADCSPPDDTPVSPDKNIYGQGEIVEIGNPVDYKLVCHNGGWYGV